MTSTHNSLPDNWPKHAQVVGEAGRCLHAQHGYQPFSAAAIRREMECIGGYARASLLPSDYCYNLLNRAGISGTYPLFIRVDRGLYRYVGPDFRYTGPIYWKPKKGPERQVGQYVTGQYTLFEDPREYATVRCQ